jgi:hypothetical protein
MERVLNFILENWEYFFGGILAFPLTFLIKKNGEFKGIVEEFKIHLPSPAKRAKTMTEAEKKSHPFLGGGMFQYITVMNTSPHEIRMDPNKMDIFYNKLNAFSYFGVIHHKRYKQIAQNLKRFENARIENKNFDIVVLQELLDKCKLGFWEILGETIVIRWRVLKQDIRMWRFDRQDRRRRKRKLALQKSLYN